MPDHHLTPNPNRLLGMADLADYLGVPLQTVRRWRVTGYGPTGFTVGRHVKYRPADVEKWLDSQVNAA
ncbi:helix-turn-helix transcriptional regulator [Kocuria turfanensis]|uniref:Helix-turn-helix domain-containing protein n=1 Tax=Kocuria turfanensis TaxID=388357 RepID=A0A512IBX8_9MICC|nr:helix-turn-helix domain-containing protein [Kocuria turfanensis]GEO95210.1 hypothetical protein KTU01_13330 [Kocuria turfanensis]